MAGVRLQKRGLPFRLFGGLRVLVDCGAVVGCGALLGCSGVVEGSAEESTRAPESPIAATFTPSVPKAGNWCGPDLEVGRRANLDAEIASVSLFQGVEVPLVGPLTSALSRVDVVEGRAALVRVVLSAPLAYTERAELSLVREDGAESFVEAPLAAGLEFQFRVAGASLFGTTRLELRIFSEGACSEAKLLRAPEPLMEASFTPKVVGAPRVVLVPLLYGSDASFRAPDLEPSDVEVLRSAVEAVFPVPGVDFRLHEPVATEGTSLDQILVDVLRLRSEEGASPGVAYFGFVNPAPSMAEYCGAKCVAGVAAMGSEGGALSAGVAVGFRGHTSETFVHELGHLYRLRHAPCGKVSQPDPDFPHEDGRLGRLGLDLRTLAFIAPESQARDFMSYCDPTWISDYNFQKLIGNISETSENHPEEFAPGEAFDYVALPEEEGASSAEVDVELVDAEGRSASQRGRRLALSEGFGSLVEVPRGALVGRSVTAVRARR